MKKIILILATATLALTGFAGNDGDDKKRKKDPDKYCAEFKDGVLSVMHNGEALTADVTLADGTIIHTDATIHKKDGSVTVMKPGQCIDPDGKLDDEPLQERTDEEVPQRK
jgi:hypothetical protein